MRGKLSIWKISVSILSITILLLLNFNGTIKFTENAKASDPGELDIQIIEVEESGNCWEPGDYPAGQKILEGEFSVIAPKADKNNYNFFYIEKYLLFGTYKYYFRAKSNIGSKLTIGINDPATTPPTQIFKEEFYITKDYRWYISQDFQISVSPVRVWAHSTHLSEYIDKIILVRWHDGTNKISNTIGQIRDKNVADSDWDGIPDESIYESDTFEYNPNVWWLEAEHFRLEETTNIVTQKDASNGKAITIKGDLTTGPSNPAGLVPLLELYYNDAFPKFDFGEEYQLFIRAKGGRGEYFCMEFGEYQDPQCVTYLSSNINYLVDNEYRWFSSKPFSTMKYNDEFWIQVYSPPPPVFQSGESYVKMGVIIDKIMVLRVRDNTSPTSLYTDHIYGQITDHLDPDTDLDCRDDSSESAV